MKKRSDSFFGIHFDLHATPGCPIGSREFADDIRSICQKVKPDFLQADCKGHPGYTSYPSKIGNACPGIEADILKVWRDVTFEEDVALYMHYSGVMDGLYCERNPEYAALRADGSRSNMSTSLTSPYVDDILIPQLMELAGDYNVNGAWIDGDCWGAETDFSERTLKAFEKETGASLNGELPTKGHPLYENFREYCRELFRRYVRKYVDAIHSAYPNFQIASNWSYTDHMPEMVTSEVDYISGDLNPWDSYRSARYCGRAIASQKMPWDLMAWNFRTMQGESPKHIAKHPVQIMQEAAAVISLGGGFQNYIRQYSDGTPFTKQALRMKEVAEFCRARQPYCHKGQAIHQTAVLLSTYDRHLTSDSLYSRNEYESIYGMVNLVCDCSHSVELCGEHILKGHYSEYPVIIIPNLKYGLDKETVRDLVSYARNGGNLILTGKTALELFSTYCPEIKIKREIKGQSLFSYNSMDYGSLCDLITIDVTDGQTVAWIDDTQRAERKECETVAAIIPSGKGKLALIGADTGEQYNKCIQYTIRELFDIILNQLYKPIVKAEKYPELEITLLEKEGRRLIQLVNAGGSHGDSGTATEDFINPLIGVSLSISCDKKPEAIILQPEGKDIPFAWENGRASLTVDVPIHEIIQIKE